MADPTTFYTGSTGFQSSVQALIRAELLNSLRGELPHLLPQVAVPAAYQKGGGTPESEATFRYFNIHDLTVGTPTPLVEGQTPTPVDLALAYMDFTAAQYGHLVRSTDLAIMQSPFNIPQQMVEKITRWGQETLDAIAKAAWNRKPAGEVVLFAQGYTDATKTPTLHDFASAATTLAGKNVEKIAGSYLAIVSPLTAHNIKTEKGEYSLLEVQKYGNPGALFKGEIGMAGGVRFIESTHATVAEGVHRSFVCGKDAISYSDLSLVQSSYIGESPTKDDPLGQRSVAGVKMFFGARTVDIGAATAADSLRYVVVEGTPSLTATAP